MHLSFKGCIAGLLLCGLCENMSAQELLPAASAQKATANFLQPGEKAVNGVQQLSTEAKRTGRQLLDPGKQLFDSLLLAGKKLPRLTIPKVNLFNAGRAISISGYHASADYTYLKDTSGLSTGLMRTMNATLGYYAGFTLTVGNLPFDISVRGNDGMYSFAYPGINNFNKFNFNHKKYLEQLQGKVLEKIKPDDLLSSIMGRINSIRQQFEKSLEKEIADIQNEFRDKFSSSLTLPPGVTDLSISDLAGLKSRLMNSEVMDKYRQSGERYQELLRSKDMQSLQNDSMFTATAAGIKEMEALEKMYEKILSYKEKFENNALVKELKSNLPFQPSQFKSYLTKPGNLVRAIKDHGNLGTLQQLFLNITRLDLGVNPVQNGSLSLQNMMNNGINAEFTGNKSSAGMIYGSGTANTNHWLQSGLTSMVSNEYSRLTGFKFGSGWNSNFRQSLSLNFFEFSASPELSGADMLQSSYLSAPARRDAVITWQSAMKVAGKHNISVDISKSLGSYQNSMADDSSVISNNAFKNVLGNEGKSTFAAAVDYSGNLLKTDLQVYVKTVGLGYNNPGNSFLRKGENRVGIGFARKIWKNRLTLRYKTDFRKQHFDPARNYTYTSFSNQLVARFRLDRNHHFGLNWRRNDFKYRQLHQMVSTGSNASLQAEGNYIFYIKKNRKVYNNFTVARQLFDMPMLIGDKYVNKTWLVTHTTSLPLGKNLASMTVMLNQSNNKEYYFNTSFFNSEFNYSYSVSEKLRLSSAVGYYANTGWNRQVGIKQQLGATVLKKLDIDIDLTYKKAVKIIRPELANQVFLTSSIHYRF